MTAEDKIQRVFAWDKELIKHFSLRPYALRGKEMVYMEVISQTDKIYLEEMVSPLDKMYDALLANHLHAIIFSLKNVFNLTDIPYAITIRMLDSLQNKGGEMIFCNASELILRGMKIVGIDQLAKFYSSEEEMLKEVFI